MNIVIEEEKIKNPQDKGWLRYFVGECFAIKDQRLLSGRPTWHAGWLLQEAAFMNQNQESIQPQHTPEISAPARTQGDHFQ